MKRVSFALIVLVLLVMPLRVGAQCNPYACFDDATDHTTCDLIRCSSGGCDPVNYWAVSCGAVCDTMGGTTQCWCVPRGECMIV